MSHRGRPLSRLIRSYKPEHTYGSTYWLEQCETRTLWKS